MTPAPRVVLSHEFPPETEDTPVDFAAAVRDSLPDIDLYQTANHQEFIEQLPSADIVVEHGISDALVEHAETLDWIHTLSSGANFYDLDEVEEIGAVLTTVSGVHARPIAEHVFALMSFFERGLHRSQRQQRRRVWHRFPAGELGTQTLGIIGVGAIGGRIAELGEAYDMSVLGLRKHPSKAHPEVDEMFGPDDLHEVLGEADYVVLACPLTPETHGLIGEEELSSMSSDAVLVNVSRGAVVEQDELVEQLRTGYLGGAALDVAETEPLPETSPLWELSNVVITPHMAGGSPRFAKRSAEIFVSNYEQYVGGSLDEMQNRIH